MRNAKINVKVKITHKIIIIKCKFRKNYYNLELLSKLGIS